MINYNSHNKINQLAVAALITFLYNCKKHADEASHFETFSFNSQDLIHFTQVILKKKHKG